MFDKHKTYRRRMNRIQTPTSHTNCCMSICKRVHVMYAYDAVSYLENLSFTWNIWSSEILASVGCGIMGNESNWRILDPNNSFQPNWGTALKCLPKQISTNTHSFGRTAHLRGWEQTITCCYALVGKKKAIIKVHTYAHISFAFYLF